MVHRLSLAAGLLILLGLAAAGCRPTVPLEDAPLPFRQAEDSFRLGHYEKAVRGYQLFLDSQDSDEEYEDLVPRAYYRMALAEYRRGRYAECLAVLDRMERRLPDREWPQVYLLRGDAELARGNTISALHWWEEAWKIADGEDKRLARDHIVAALGRMDPSSLAQARAVFTTVQMQARVDERLKVPPGARPPGATAPSRPQPTVQPAAPPPSLTRDEGTGGRPARIGVLLPLTGQFASYGQRSLNAVKLALGPQTGALVVRDTKGEAATARAAFDELTADLSVVAVLGPLRSKEAEAIAPRAEHSGIPLLVLAQQAGIRGRWIVQTTMTAEQQATALAEYAVGNRGLRKLAIFYPNDQYGAPLAAAFRQQVEARGGQIVGSVTYEPNQQEFSVELLSAEKWSKDDGLQGVFIPDFASTALPLARQLRHSLPQIELFGSNGWGDPSALGKAADDIDGAVFVDGFFATSQRRAVQQFVAAYRAAYGGVPDILDAQAYDAAKLVGIALGSGVSSRTQMLGALQATRSYEGAAGTVNVSPTGIQRQLFMLRVAGGAISEINPGRGQ